MKEIAPDLAVVPLKIANVYLVGTRDRWYLVDSGLPGEAVAIRNAVAARFGDQSKPLAIVLTHGHVDHSGSALALADDWKVQVFAPRLEMPFLSGRSEYPPPDPSAPGFLALLSRFVKSVPVNLGSRLSELNENDPFPGLPGWEVISTPGHSPGHTSFFRASDGLLLAGDAIATVNTDSLIAVLRKKQTVSRPPAPSTINWSQAGDSVARLARLHPKLLAAGHGVPMLNQGHALQKLADHFPVPKKGRYVQGSVETNDQGVTSLPPAPPDHLAPVLRSLLVAALAVGVGTAYGKFRTRFPRRS